MGRSGPGGGRRGHGVGRVEALYGALSATMAGDHGGGRRSVRVQVVKVPPLVGRLLQLILGLWAKR